ncbi:MAG TPA: hypothetical protein VKG26_12595 [Bacteroidia bacterium]|nr:hypothetical protein [Bacteroidia bacterium]
MEAWHDFFVAVAGAAAALTGLIFVGVSLSLTKMLAIPRLADRASEALILLVTVLIISCLCLVPQQPYSLLGIEFLCIGLAIWFITLKLDITILKATDKEYKGHYKKMIVFSQAATLPYIIAGITTLSLGYAGIYWLIPAIVFSFSKAVLDAWVILVEIHR